MVSDIVVWFPSAGEQAEVGEFHPEDLQSDDRPDVHVWHASEADPRVQATTTEHPTHHHALQPSQGQPEHAVRLPHSHDGRQGNVASASIGVYVYYIH